MEYGAHLPLLDIGTPPTLRGLRAYAETAAGVGLPPPERQRPPRLQPTLAGRPTALATVIDESGDMTLATSVALPSCAGPPRWPRPSARWTSSRTVACSPGVGPGSSARDYAAAGVPFEERWRRFDGPSPPCASCSTATSSSPGRSSGRARRSGSASWGSPAGLRRVARHGDGWLASAYNITPERFREAAAALPAMPNGLATAWLCVTEDAAGAERVLADVLAPLVGRPVEELRSRSLPIGPAEVCAERMRAFADAGVQRIFLWPLRDEARQLELFMERVAPLV